MAIPTDTILWAESLDPADVADFAIDCNPLLVGGESVASFDVSPTSESVLLGLTIGTGDYAPAITAGVIRVWLSIGSAHQSDAAFDSAGTTLPITITVKTTSSPPRTRQRTVAVKVLQR